MNRALVLSGGEAKGAFQVGAIDYLMTKKDYRWNSGLFGVSVGALNVGILGYEPFYSLEGLDKLVNIWKNIKESDIYKKYNFLQLAWRIISGKTSFYDNTPLYRLIKENIPSISDAWVGYVDLKTGEYVLAKATPENMFKSATMPIFWSPVEGRYVDGGLRNITPLGDAIDIGADEIVVITCSPLGISPGPEINNLLAVAKRSLDIAMNEIAVNDIKFTLTINDLVRQAHNHNDLILHKEDGTAYRHVKITLIEPEHSLETDKDLDFRRETILDRMNVGYLKAKKVVP